MKYKLLLMLLLISINNAEAAEPIKLVASAPFEATVDKPFSVVYAINASASDLIAPDFGALEVLAGPYLSTMSNYENINGKVTSYVATKFTFTLQSTKTGTYTIPSASIVVKGKKYISKGLSIRVLSATENPKAQKSNTKFISDENVFIRTNLSKTTVNEQECILLTYKLYFNTSLEVSPPVLEKTPVFKGFMMQAISEKNNQLSYENYKGKYYSSAVIYKFLLFPQSTGEIKIEKINFKIAIKLGSKNKSKSIYDGIFGKDYSVVEKTLTAPEAIVTVNPLPNNKPSSFSGVVGNLSIGSSISSNVVKVNEPVTLKINISGTGNMKMLKRPNVKLPDSFESYDPKESNDFKVTTDGMTGTKTVDYLFIPREVGDFEIPSVEIAYFDSKTGTYKIVSTQRHKVVVTKDNINSTTASGTYVNKEDVKQLAKDIRFIETSTGDLYIEKEPLFGTWLAWLLYIVPAIVVAALFFVFRKQTQNNSDIELVRNRKANKQAQKRLKLALKLLKDANKDQFYEEVLKSVWNYLSDKLAIPAASLTKERIESELLAREVDTVLIDQFKNILNVCEFARYAPNAGQQAMGNLYDETINAISNLENVIRKA